LSPASNPFTLIVLFREPVRVRLSFLFLEVPKKSLGPPPLPTSRSPLSVISRADDSPFFGASESLLVFLVPASEALLSTCTFTTISPLEISRGYYYYLPPSHSLFLRYEPFFYPGLSSLFVDYPESFGGGRRLGSEPITSFLPSPFDSLVLSGSNGLRLLMAESIFSSLLIYPSDVFIRIRESLHSSFFLKAFSAAAVSIRPRSTCYGFPPRPDPFLVFLPFVLFFTPSCFTSHVK